MYIYYLGHIDCADYSYRYTSSGIVYLIVGYQMQVCLPLVLPSGRPVCLIVNTSIGMSTNTTGLELSRIRSHDTPH